MSELNSANVAQVTNCCPCGARRTCVNLSARTNEVVPIEFRTNNFLCSECKEKFFADSDGVNYPIDWAYCPNCGAEVVR